MTPRALVAALLPAVWLCGTAAAATLTVTVHNIGRAEGQVRVAVYDQASWLDEPRWAVSQPAPREPAAGLEARFELPPGTYAVAVLHDVNENGVMDYRLLRRPKEPYGFSNGVVPRFGPPKFEAAAFAVGTDAVDLAIELRD